jgi:hypothetical protein
MQPRRELRGSNGLATPENLQLRECRYAGRQLALLKKTHLQFPQADKARDVIRQYCIGVAVAKLQIREAF